MTKFSKTTKEVADHYGISERSVIRWIEAGMFKYGVEYIDLRMPGGRKAKLRFNIDSIDKTLATPPEKR
jgi:transposase